MKRSTLWTGIVLSSGLLSGALLSAQNGAARSGRSQAACAQIRKACAAAGFTAGGNKGQRLQKDCFEPILEHQSRSADGGRRLPAVDPAVVEACRPESSTSTADNNMRPLASGGVRPPEPPSSGNVKNSDSLLMSEPEPLFTGTSLGMNAMPDQQTPILHSSEGTYQLFVTGVQPGQPGGVVSILSTPNLTQPSLYKTSGPVLRPPQNKGSASKCNPTASDDCADYVGMEAVFETDTPHKLVGFYIADQAKFDTRQACNVKGAFYGQLMVATATQDGKVWSAGKPTLRGAPVPRTCPTHTGPAAFNQPTVIKIGSYYYAYFALPTSGKAGIAVARAPVENGGLPGSWSVLSGGKWTAVPTPASGQVQTIDTVDMVVPTQGYVTMPWTSYNTYLQTYLMTMITHDGFYYSRLEKSSPKGSPTQSDIDAQKWSAPQLFQAVPGGANWAKCAVTWENMSFVTPGAPDNHTTGKDGYVVLSVVPGWACGKRGTRSFDIASYSFGVNAPPAPPIAPPRPLPTPRPAPCRNGRPGCQK